MSEAEAETIKKILKMQKTHKKRKNYKKTHKKKSYFLFLIS